MSALPELGVGIGWRPEIAGFVAGLPGLRFCEVIAESLHTDGPLTGPLADLRAGGVHVVPHGVTLSLGGAEPVAAHRVEHLRRCAELLAAPLVSEHIAFVRAGEVEAGHLLPIPRTRDSLAVLVDNIRRTQDGLAGVPFAVEPIAALFDWPDADFDEPDFLTEVVSRTDALLLLDVANVYANARNRGEDPLRVLERMPLERVAYVHVAGGSEEGGLYHDTHTDPVPDAVLELVEALAARARPAGYLLERDGSYPAAEILAGELDAIAAAAGYPQVTAATVSG